MELNKDIALKVAMERIVKLEDESGDRYRQLVYESGCCGWQ